MSVRILQGDCREVLKTLPDESVHCVVTSPPYWGLRDYGVDGQIGLDATPDAYVASMVEVFREARRVLRDDCTIWLNIGDSYSNAGTRQGDRGGSITKEINAHRKVGSGYRPRVVGLKNKDLIGMPWRVAFELQADGWYLRQDIVWSKPNCTPEGRVSDRCTKSHEYIFLLTKSANYYFDIDAIAENVSDIPNVEISGEEYFSTRNKRSVWTVTTKPFSGAHFATFPPDLIEPCILAGCPVGGIVLDPFGGAGTTGLVADRHGRDAILIELNPEYAEMARQRITGDAPLFAEVII